MTGTWSNTYPLVWASRVGVLTIDGILCSPRLCASLKEGHSNRSGICFHSFYLLGKCPGYLFQMGTYSIDVDLVFARGGSNIRNVDGKYRGE
jgi:hypothetical protein